MVLGVIKDAGSCEIAKQCFFSTMLEAKLDNFKWLV